MSFDESKYGFQGGFSSHSQWDSAFSSTNKVRPAPMQMPPFDRGQIEMPGNVTMKFVPTSGTAVTMKTEEVMTDGEKHTKVTVQMPPQFEQIMNRRVVTVGDKCHQCNSGTMQGKITRSGLMAGIIFFPCGIAITISTRNRVCNHCGLAYDYQGNKIS